MASTRKGSFRSLACRALTDTVYFYVSGAGHCTDNRQNGQSLLGFARSPYLYPADLVTEATVASASMGMLPAAVTGSMMIMVVTMCVGIKV